MGEYLNLPYDLLEILQELGDAEHGNKLQVQIYMNYYTGPWDQEAHTTFGVSNLSRMDFTVYVVHGCVNMAPGDEDSILDQIYEKQERLDCYCNNLDFI